jgi:hypothetical protein
MGDGGRSGSAAGSGTTNGAQSPSSGAATSPSASPGSQDAGTRTGAGQTGAAAASETRQDGQPPWLPDKFRTPEDLAKSYRELEQRQFRRRDDLRAEIEAEIKAKGETDVPHTPQEYKFDEIELADGRRIGLDPKDPMTAWFQNTAHALRVPQGQYQSLVEQYWKIEAQRGPNWAEESKLLGNRAEDRLDRVEKWMRGHSPQEVYDSFAGLKASAATVKMFEHLMTLAGEPSIMLDGDGAPAAERMSPQLLAQMQRDPKYWRDKDPLFIQQVKAGWRALSSGR